jgi:hypothetical protein
MIWQWLSSFRRIDYYEKTYVRRSFGRDQLPGLWWHRISGGRATGAARSQNLSRSLQAMPRQRASRDARRAIIIGEKARRDAHARGVVMERKPRFRVLLIERLRRTP